MYLDTKYYFHPLYLAHRHLFSTCMMKIVLQNSKLLHKVLYREAIQCLSISSMTILSSRTTGWRENTRPHPPPNRWFRQTPVHPLHRASTSRTTRRVGPWWMKPRARGFYWLPSTDGYPTTLHFQHKQQYTRSWNNSVDSGQYVRYIYTSVDNNN